MKTELEKNLLAFTLLVTQSEFYGIALKGNVHHEFSYRLNEYLRTSKQLIAYINKFIDSDTLEDNSEEIANFIENLIQSNNTNN
jgi:hypothetical protein